MKINKYLFSLMALVMTLFMAGCSPDDYSLGDKNLTSDDLAVGTAFTITHDSSNPNIVYLKSLLSGYTVLWNLPDGSRSQANEVTLKEPFAGTYTVSMGVETRGGYVYGPKATFTIDSFCSDFVSGDLWTYLTGGVGKSKKWYLDLDATATCRYFVGPLYFYGTADNWNSVTLGEKITGDSWSWAADWAGNGSWLFGGAAAMDYGYMEFGLSGGATCKVLDNQVGKTYDGSFVMDVDKHTMTISNAPVLHDASRESIVTQWGNVTILALDENHMQLAVLRDNSSEGKCLLSYNFISEDYRKNWTPSVVNNTDVVPTLDTDWKDYVEPKTSNQMTYKLDADAPYVYSNLDGSIKDYTMPAANDGIEDMKLTFDHKANTYTVTMPDATEYTGTYTLSDAGVYTFSNALPVLQLSKDGTINFGSNADNTLRITKIVKDDYSNSLSDLYLGKAVKDDQNNVIEYVSYHFKLQSGAAQVTRYTGNLNWFNSSYAFQKSDNVFITTEGSYTFTVNGAGSDPYGLYLDVFKIKKDHPNVKMTITDIKVDGKSISFDDSAIEEGSGDAATTYRRYIVNPWGATAASASNYVFTSTVSVTVNVKFND
jgi:hypothetical protein